MALTFAEIRGYYLNDMLEIALATPEQIARLCIEMENDIPLRVYDNAKEELAYMVSDAVGEFMR